MAHTWTPKVPRGSPVTLAASQEQHRTGRVVEQEPRRVADRGRPDGGTGTTLRQHDHQIDVLGLRKRPGSLSR